MFGHKKGSFTGALTDHKGFFEQAEGGTLFLDEIGDLPLDSQVRLLRVLERAHEIVPVGASKPVKVNVRIVAATHRDLAAEVVAGRFREDLYHRLSVAVLELPPLRDRGADLRLLINFFLNEINTDSLNRPEASSNTLSGDAIESLLRHPWPGNIRELYHTLLRASIFAQGAEITAVDVQENLLAISGKGDRALPPQIGQGIQLDAYLDEISADLIRQALAKAGNRKGEAAKLLGFENYQTLSNWMKRLGIDGA